MLAKRSVRDSSYPAVISSFAVLAPFDTGIGLLVLLYAITQGLLPAAPELPDLAAFDVSFWAAHPDLLLLALTLLAIGALVLYAVLARRATAVWKRFIQGFAIFREPRRYLREVAAWQLAAWFLRFVSFWLFLDAFHIGGSAQNVLLVMSVLAISGALPLTPGGAGAQQALLVATLEGPSRVAVLSYSVGQQIAVTAWSVRGRVHHARHRLPDRRLEVAGEGGQGGAERRAGGRDLGATCWRTPREPVCP